MTQETMTSRAIEYVLANPGSSAEDVARALGTVTHPSVYMALYRAAQSGKLSANMEAGEGRKGNPRRFYPPAPEAPGSAVVIARARRLGGPFGILVAQVAA